MHAIPLFAEAILPSEGGLLVLAGFVSLIIIGLIGVWKGLKLQLDERRRLGLWVTWLSLAFLSGLVAFVMYGCS